METILVCDIGGTNSNLAIAALGTSVRIQHKIRESTAKYDDFTRLLDDYLERIPIKITGACLAIAGPVAGRRVEMTNTALVIDAEEIKTRLHLGKVLLINDFAAIGYATNRLDGEDAIVLNPGKPRDGALKAVVGAGTGLGKSLLVYQKDSRLYLPYPSEGGHTDIPLFGPEENALASTLPQPTYEDFLSGRGLEFLYSTLQRASFPHAPPNLLAKEISEARNLHPCARTTFELFVKFYARCARNFAIDLMAQGGVYLAGGIAASNPDVFLRSFMEEFVRHPLPKFEHLLRDIPVTLISNYDISLKGAALAYAANYPRNGSSR